MVSPSSKSEATAVVPEPEVREKKLPPVSDTEIGCVVPAESFLTKN